jgi:ribonucleoside-diphosphate reductase alpha chain
MLDYIFRELAVSYLDRFDLAHVDPSQGSFDALGKGVEEGKPSAAPATKYMSRGLTRSRADKLVVMRRTAPQDGTAATNAVASNVTAISSAVALKDEPQAKLSPAEKLEQLPWPKTEARTESVTVTAKTVDAKADAKAQAAERSAEARARGYEGEMCGECGNFTLVRNGTCMKCDTCGSTTGCS